jgi:hypothetical protein
MMDEQEERILLKKYRHCVKSIMFYNDCNKLYLLIATYLIVTPYKFLKMIYDSLQLQMKRSRVCVI